MSRRKNPRNVPVHVDFQRLIERDTLISQFPVSITSDLKLLGWINENVDFVRRLLR
jgi:hypothetical protein